MFLQKITRLLKILFEHFQNDSNMEMKRKKKKQRP